MTPILHRRPALPSLMAGLALATLAAFTAGPAVAQEAAIRKAISERLPNLPPIDEVNKAPIAGLYEVRIGTEIFYSDPAGEYLVQGALIETKTRTNITEARIEKLTAVDFSALPLKDAMVWKQGTGARKMVVFADPNCGYCKRFEKDLQKVKDVTVYTFLYPILGGDSPEKSKNIWCAKDSTKAWRDWMLDGTAPSRTMGNCDTSPMQRNLAFGKKHRLNGTPSIVFEDGSRVPGAMTADQVEQRLATARAKS